MQKIEMNFEIYPINSKVYAIDYEILDYNSVCTVCNGSTKLKVEGQDLYLDCTFCNKGLVKTSNVMYKVIELTIDKVSIHKYIENTYEKDIILYSTDSNKIPRGFYFYDIEHATLFESESEAYAVLNDKKLLEEYVLKNHTKPYRGWL